MTQKQVSKRWLEGAEEAQDTAQSLFKLNKYNHSLFFAQLYLEKLIKALHYHLKDSHPLPIHNLVQLLKKIGVIITQKQEKELRTITRFNITARYHEDRQKIYQLANKEYTKNWLIKTNNLGKFIKNKFTE
ncbi:MAG: HEPN domain-containing protein [Candidatus Beckwithbacteria bacterium]|nr:HEPN domain-containing protein [Patescibacteria group bacterium]